MHLSPLAARIALYVISRLPFLMAESRTSYGRYLCREGGASTSALECLFVCPATLQNTLSISPDTPVDTTAWTSTLTNSVEEGAATATPTTNEASSTSTQSEPNNDATMKAKPVRAHFPSFDDWRGVVLKQNIQQRPSYRSGPPTDKPANEADTDYYNRSGTTGEYDGYGEDSAYLFDADERLDQMAASRRNSGSYPGRPMSPPSVYNTGRNNVNGDNNNNKEEINASSLDRPSGTPVSSNDITDALATAATITATMPTPPVDMKDMRDQSNYASFDCGATVLASNSEAKGATAILFDTKEQYMLNRCSVKKFVIIELCDEILVDTVMLANHEFFSSMFKDFRISVTDQYIRNGNTNWRTLGHYQARNARDLQAFHVENPILWTRYLRIDFLSHYGNEYYCPVSVLRVYGPTMMEQYRREEQAAESAIADQILKEAATLTKPTKQIETLTNSLSNEVVEHVDVESAAVPDNESPITDYNNNNNSTQPIQDQQPNASSVNHDVEATATATINNTEPLHDNDSQSSLDTMPSVDVTSSSSISVDSASATQSVSVSDTQDENSAINATITTSTAATTSHLSDNDSNKENTDHVSIATTDVSTSISGPTPSATANAQNSSVDTPTVTVHAVSTSAFSSFSSSAPSSLSSIPAAFPSSSLSPSPVVPIIPPPPAATTQESIFRTITKRLSALELNLTLSHRYLEEQSRELNRVFANVESQFETLKTRVESDLAKRLEKQQVQTEAILQELHQLNLKVHVLADEIMFEKRMGFIQLLLIFAVVVLVGIVYVPVSVWFPSASSNAIMSWTPISGQVSISPFLRAHALSAPASPNSGQFPSEQPSSLSPPHSRSVPEALEVHSPTPTKVHESMISDGHNNSYSDPSDPPFNEVLVSFMDNEASSIKQSHQGIRRQLFKTARLRSRSASMSSLQKTNLLDSVPLIGYHRVSSERDAFRRSINSQTIQDSLMDDNSKNDEHERDKSYVC